MIFKKILTLLSGMGKPQSKDLWETQYTQGQWNRLKTLDELAHYSIIVGYSAHFGNGGNILDVGCGEGLLQEKLKPYEFSFYHGIDLSEKAIQLASRLSDSKTLFSVENCQSFQTEKKYDFIIFNESLYYFDDPLEILNKYQHFLTQNGVLIVSMVFSKRSFFICYRLKNKFKVVDTNKVKNKHGEQWIINVLRPCLE